VSIVAATTTEKGRHLFTLAGGSLINNTSAISCTSASPSLCSVYVIKTSQRLLLLMTMMSARSASLEMDFRHQISAEYIHVYSINTTSHRTRNDHLCWPTRQLIKGKNQTIIYRVVQKTGTLCFVRLH